MKVRHGHGGTIGLIAISVLVVAVLGFAFYFLAKFMGAGRELSNAGDAGCLNVAKQLMRLPGKTAAEFPPPNRETIVDNFDVYSDMVPATNGPRRVLNLATYNKLLVHAVIVAINARDLNTVTAANHARAVWQALNDVGNELRRETGDNTSPGTSVPDFFKTIAEANNTKMLNNNKVTLSGFNIAYMRPGQSSNVYVNPAIFSSGLSNIIPINSGGSGFPGNGFKYMAGYEPFAIDLPRTGDTLFYAAVPTLPFDRTHLVPQAEFTSRTSDGFVVGRGSPSYPERSLPANSFLTRGETTEPKTNARLHTLACAIVGSRYPGNTHQHQFDMQYGYLLIKNGPPAEIPVAPLANGDNDIFNRELAAGIAYQDIGGSHVLFTDQPHWDATGDPNGWDAWANYNNGIGPRPNSEISKRIIKKDDGSQDPTIPDLERIQPRSAERTCLWTDYPGHPGCENLLNDFKAAFHRTGSDDNFDATGATALEKYKIVLLQKRWEGWQSVRVDAPRDISGIKFFDHSQPYAAPDGGTAGRVTYNFGKVASPYEYLQMIDQVSTPPGQSAGCGLATIFDAIVGRCKQIKPNISREAVANVLKYGRETVGPRSVPLPLNGSLYVYKEGDNLVMKPTPPNWITPGTEPDGIPFRCGTPYPVVFSYVNTNKANGSPFAHHNGDGSFHQLPYGSFEDNPGQNTACTDSATLTLASGWNHLLLKLDLSQTCSGGGEFSKPN